MCENFITFDRFLEDLLSKTHDDKNQKKNGAKTSTNQNSVVFKIFNGM